MVVAAFQPLKYRWKLGEIWLISGWNDEKLKKSWNIVESDVSTDFSTEIWLKSGWNKVEIEMILENFGFFSRKSWKKVDEKKFQPIFQLIFIPVSTFNQFSTPAEVEIWLICAWWYFQRIFNAFSTNFQLLFSIFGRRFFQRLFNSVSTIFSTPHKWRASRFWGYKRRRQLLVNVLNLFVFVVISVVPRDLASS